MTAQRSWNGRSNAATCEIAAIEAELLAGNPDIEGLVLALSDWSAELRIVQNEKRRRAQTRRRDVNAVARIRL